MRPLTIIVAAALMAAGPIAAKNYFPGSGPGEWTWKAILLPLSAIGRSHLGNPGQNFPPNLSVLPVATTI